MKMSNHLFFSQNWSECACETYLKVQLKTESKGKQKICSEFIPISVLCIFLVH